jgi:hypothetical protein
LFERKEKRELIEKYLDEAFLDGELELVRREFGKIKNKGKLILDQNELSYEQKSKVIEKLMTR